MIGRIRGILVEKAPGQALVECAGLGYEVDIPYTTFFHLPAMKSPCTPILPSEKTPRASTALLPAWTGTSSAC